MNITKKKITRGLFVILIIISIVLVVSYYKYDLFYKQEIHVDRKLRFIEMTNSILHPFFNGGSVKEYNHCGWGSEKIICLDGEIIKRVRFYKNGKIWCKIPIKYCSSNGLARHYFKNGKVDFEIEYSFGIKNGKAREYYYNGQLKKEFTYQNNLLHGDLVEYDSTGTVMLSEKYQFGRKIK